MTGVITASSKKAGIIGVMTENVSYQCPECGLHYADLQTAKECEAFCSANRACSMEITKHSLEAQKSSSVTTD